jgi:hypothetical protein
MAVAISPVRLASPRPGVWELSVTVGCDTDPHSWRVYRTVHGSDTGASRGLPRSLPTSAMVERCHPSSRLIGRNRPNRCSLADV